MKKLLQGILDFRTRLRPQFKETFAQLALTQSPDCLLYCCAESRAMPNVHASTSPGDTMILGTLGNSIGPYDPNALDPAAEIEFALHQYPIRDLVVCGHSHCAVVQSLLLPASGPSAENYSKFLEKLKPSRTAWESGKVFDGNLLPQEQLSQTHVWVQMENLKTYPLIQERLEKNSLRIHGWWFDLAQAEVYAFEPEENRFVLMNEEEITRFRNRLDAPAASKL